MSKELEPWSEEAGNFAGTSLETRTSYTGGMTNEFAAIFERDGEWTVAYCPEIPGANGQGRTQEEARGEPRRSHRTNTPGSS